ncbi:MAG: UDP-glucose dehydrogenase family protein [Desulfovibrionales bacterium]
MHVAIVGTGYVGLVSGACLAEKGHQVVCVDVDESKVERINRADPPIYEKGLAQLLSRNVGDNLRATRNLEKAVLGSEISLIAVGTPFDGGRIDLRFIREVAGQIGTVLKKSSSYHVVVVKSTVVPGTTDQIVLPLLESKSGKKAGRDFGVGMNPEFLREGEAVEDFLHPDRIVLGGMDQRTMEIMERLYAVFPGVDILRTGNSTAEMIKYAANSLLATMISFSNEIANLCTALGSIDATEVMKGVHLDKRFCPIQEDGGRVRPGFTTYLEPGCGFGGSCFPKDVKALISHGDDAGSPMEILKAVMEVNERQPHQILKLVDKHFPSLTGVTLAVLGLAFKPGTDDMRESPAIPVIQGLLERGGQVTAFDPVAADEAKQYFGNNQVQYARDLPAAIRGADAVILLTRWDEFSSVPELLSAENKEPVLIDGRRMLKPNCTGRYEGIGL